jgi:DNA mismatch endonuclease, patch repair protein
MADVFSKAKRSQVMSRIRSRGNKETELALAKLLRRYGIQGWRRHFEIRGRGAALRRPRTARRSVPTKTGAHGVTRPTFRVKPDFVFPKHRLAVFVDGCFWHSCPKHATKPKNNASFWRRKLAGNKRRDWLVNRTLRRAGWRVFRIWEHALRQATMKRATKKPQDEARLIRRIQRTLV